MIRQRNYGPYLGLALLTGIVSLDLAWRATAPAPAVKASSLGEDTEARLAQLEVELAALRRSLRARPPLVASRPAVDPTAWAKRAAEVQTAQPVRQELAEPASTPDTAPRKGEIDGEREDESTHDELRLRFDEEQVDEAWASRREEELESALRGELGSGYLRDAQCRSSFCRVEIEHPDGSSLDLLVLEMMTKPAFSGRRAHLQMDAETGRMTVYLAREGARLAPDVPLSEG